MSKEEKQNLGLMLGIGAFALVSFALSDKETRRLRLANIYSHIDRIGRGITQKEEPVETIDIEYEELPSSALPLPMNSESINHLNMNK